MKYKTLFFDLDDTLWDTAYNSKEALEELYTKYKLNNYFENFDSFYQPYLNNNTDLWEKYGKGLISKQELIVNRFTTPFKGILDINESDAVEMNRDFLECTSSKSKVVDKAIEVLNYLQPLYQMHIVSNGFTEVQYKKMQNSGLDSYFDKIILSDSLGVNKPHPDIFSHALNVADATREETVMIGDSWSADIVGARDSSIDQIWYNPAGFKTQDFDATYTISSLLELKEIL